ncbi:cold shock domain-containing protein [Williamsia sp. 1135]|uniref:cold-shock protein n=1 Tax=Williamsia sp. 1135 TaxID=1889262 RepID=UPI000A117AD7|nr:cold shock domain-containing protein [Williamsia sp. 1135]ORM29087.1 cold-shock protein [Williamsia sp. 1135]
MSVSGKIVHFDANKGFGFLAPDAGGSDVFLHINDIDIDEHSLKPGAAVEFDIEETDRGSKAVNLVVTGGAPAGAPDRPRRTEGARDGGRPDRRHDDRGSARDDRRKPARSGDAATLDSGTFSEEITELLLDASGTLTASQILAIRQRVTDFAIARGWVFD